MLESVIQKKIINYLNKQGYTTINLIKTNLSGIPDLICTKGGQCLYVEVKRPGGVLSELQKYRIKKLRENGDIVMIPYSYEEFLELYLLKKTKKDLLFKEKVL